MSSVTFPTLVALIIQLSLGAAVFQANPRRRSNQCFLLLSVAIGLWLASLYFAFGTPNPEIAALAIREASAAGITILAIFNILRLSIRHRHWGWAQLLRHSAIWIAATVVVIGFCYTDAFLHGATMRPNSAGIPTAAAYYGRWSFLYALYFTGATVTVLALYLRDYRTTTGGEKAELAFILIGVIVAFGLVLIAFALGYFVDSTRLTWFAPFRTVLFTLVIAYGIATRKILEVGVFLRRSMAYVVLTCYLVALYALLWWLVGKVFLPFLGDAARSLAHLIAAVSVAFAMAPAKGFSQTLAERLFVGTKRLDFQATMRKAADILTSVSTLDQLLEKFARTISEAVDTERIFILLPSREGFRQQYPPAPADASEAMIALDSDHPVILHLQTDREPIVLDELHRVRATPALASVRSAIEAIHIGAAIGIFSREHLAGIMLLGPRLSGRIYGTVEQNALQVLSGQLAVAIENARLFTEVQNAKLYNETLLENLTSGVIAVGADERVTVFNNEAGQITGLDPRDVIDRPIGNLPESIRDVLRDTLHSVEQQENKEIALQPEQETVVARASSAIFHGQEGEMLGALMVLTDITALKRLEQQIRRSDRLASLGTLSAGMAHEIKNPLVSIKTFAQLLPERYQDSDFRETFSNLIGHEIDRIDSLVNQLLRFARPAKPLLKPMHVHDVLEKSLMLVGHRLYQKEINLSRSWNAEVDTIRADADQLEQVFLNFFLNAMDAMNRGGELIVSTEIRSAEEWIASVTSNRNDDVREILCVTVQDNGEGIKNEDIAHVFDPFFTTKDYGTGLGLSVVHGIIQEHGGEIEVESELAKGTSFHILLPLVRFQEEVAAA